MAVWTAGRPNSLVEQEVIGLALRARPAWLRWAALLVSLVGAVLQGFLFGESDPVKYRPFAPKLGGAEEETL